MAVQAKKVFIGILKSLNSVNDVSYNMFLKLFDSKIAPVLLYGAEVWGFSDFQVLESVHLYACKRFLNVKTSTPNAKVHGECGLYSMYILHVQTGCDRLKQVGTGLNRLGLVWTHCDRLGQVGTC